MGSACFGDERHLGNWHVTGNAGARSPNDMHKNTAQLHYSLQVDHYLNRYFIPFAAANAFTTLNGARESPVFRPS